MLTNYETEFTYFINITASLHWMLSAITQTQKEMRNQLAWEWCLKWQKSLHFT